MKLYRRRYLPKELLWLRDDEIILADDEKIVTAWTSLKPRPDFSHGRSCYFLHKNYKISKFYGHDGSLCYYYCDIIKAEAVADGYIFHDLLVDVHVLTDGRTAQILDLDELAAAFEQGEITGADVICALNALHELLAAIYSGQFVNDILKTPGFDDDER